MGLLDAMLNPRLFLDGLPTPARLYIDSVVKGKKEPITEADFTPSELDAIRALTTAGDNGAVNYGTYQKPESNAPDQTMFGLPLSSSAMVGLMGMYTPKSRIGNSLGQFNYQNDPEGTTVTDAYDFNPVYGDQSMLLKALSVLGTGGFSALHMIGEKVLPPGTGRPVKIRLPKR